MTLSTPLEIVYKPVLSASRQGAAKCELSFTAAAESSQTSLEQALTVVCAVADELVMQTSSNTIDVRGMRPSVALMTVEDELAELNHLNTVFVVHGVGTGSLRQEIHAYLKRDKSVKRFSLEENSNGGCTVVQY